MAFTSIALSAADKDAFQGSNIEIFVPSDSNVNLDQIQAEDLQSLQESRRSAVFYGKILYFSFIVASWTSPVLYGHPRQPKLTSVQMKNCLLMQS